MRDNYDFSEATKNPFVKDKTKRQVTIRLEDDVVDYFKLMAEETGVPYQSLINLYLKDCVNKKKSISIE